MERILPTYTNIHLIGFVNFARNLLSLKMSIINMNAL